MRIQVSGQRIDIGEALTAHVTRELEETCAKYAGRPTDASVVFSREGHLSCCEIVVHLSTGLTATAKGATPEIYAAFEEARERMAKQLRRHKRRLKDHHRDRQVPVDTLPAMATVLAPFAEEGDEGEAEGLAGPAIIAEIETRLPSLTVSEAVMQMELAHAPVLVFRNEKGGALNVVYRREDGNIGWIDPRSQG